MPDDSTTTMLAPRRKRMNRALEAIKRMAPPAHHHFKCLVIFVSTDFAACHVKSPQKNRPNAQKQGALLAAPPRFASQENCKPDAGCRQKGFRWTFFSEVPG